MRKKHAPVFVERFFLFTLSFFTGCFCFRGYSNNGSFVSDFLGITFLMCRFGIDFFP